MGRTKIGIVVHDGFLFACLVEQLQHFLAQHRIQCVVRADDNNVVLFQFGVYDIQPLFGIIFVEDIFGIAVVIQKGKLNGRFPVRKYVDVVRGDMIVTHEPEDDIAYMVVAGFTDETDWNAGAAQ